MRLSAVDKLLESVDYRINTLTFKILASQFQSKSFDKCKKVLDDFINTHEMSKLDAASIKKRFDEKNKLAYPLLQW